MNKQRGPAFFRYPILWLSETPKGNLSLLLLAVIVPACAVVFFDLRDASLDVWTAIKASTSFGVAAWAMWANFGPPINWWKPFFGVEMRANREKIARREQSGESAKGIQLELEAWVQEMATSRWYKTNPYTYKFLRKADAAMFKLAWS
jgi:hypothetical protein